MKNILADIYKNRIENLLNGLFHSINSIEEIGYIGKTYDELKNLKPTEEEINKFWKLKDLNENTEEYKILHRKLSVWKLLNSCIDQDNNSIAELIDKINALQNKKINIALNHKSEPIEQIETGYILFFDTETTGLPRNWKAPVSDLNNWPRLVQLAFILCDHSGNTIQQGDYIVKPNNYIIPEEASAIHGITNEKANKEGLPISLVLQNFDNLVKHSDYLVAHNISFDEKIVGAELLRNNMINSLSERKKICTMEKTIDFCAIEGPYGFKWPKLSELYYELFGTYFEESHNAAVDIKATSKCFWELRKKKLI